jgi:hypothetical protein
MQALEEIASRLIGLPSTSTSTSIIEALTYDYRVALSYEPLGFVVNVAGLAVWARYGTGQRLRDPAARGPSISL